MLILRPFFFILLSNANLLPTHGVIDNAQAKSDSFDYPDRFLLDCGAVIPGAGIFLNDNEASKYLSYHGDDIQVAVSPSRYTVPSPIYLSARVFDGEATYAFPVSRSGWHWIRLHFAPIPNNSRDLRTARFGVRTSNDIVLIHEFDPLENITWSYREFLLNVTTERFSITFEPDPGRAAFVNAVEFASAPDILIGDVATAVFPRADYSGLLKVAYQTVYRFNVGGPLITPRNDTLGRTWISDDRYLESNFSGNGVAVEPNVITYPGNESPLIAPPMVYASAVQLVDAYAEAPNSNITWKMKIESSFQYLVRLHFADIVSRAGNELYFNVYINGKPAITGLDLTTAAGGLTAAYHADFVVNSSMFSSFDALRIQIGPMNESAVTKNAILNGVEVMKMNSSVGSLDGEFGVHGEESDGRDRTKVPVAAVGFVMMFGSFAGLGAMVVKWRKRPSDWQRSKSFSTWLLPLHTGDASFISNSKASSLDSKRSHYFSSSDIGIGRYFSLADLQFATKNWDSGYIVGVGGFGNVYAGVIDDGARVAIKRGNPQSEQGITEFQTEIQMLSKLRHRHLVSLIGYCDENSEMILVYEFMSNGPLRDHLYGKKNLPPLSWKQRLEICIGAARGLHYLHTGTATGIIHRDVKTTNILLDDTFVAKMADFGLSKNAPAADKLHVSTAVKGSFGYLDPEYFMKQQLTDKSDVYSFGVVLLEVICARPAIDPGLPKEQVSLAEWGIHWKRKGLMEKIIDPKLIGDIEGESMVKFVEAAEKCLAECGAERPTMGDVLWNLELALQLQLQEAGSEGKPEEENKNNGNQGPASVVSSAAGGNQVEIQVVDEQPRKEMYSQFDPLQGR